MEQINEIKTQIWNYIQYLRGKIGEELSDKYVIPGDIWFDRYKILRSRFWLIDQLYFARSEAEFWKNQSLK